MMLKKMSDLLTVAAPVTKLQAQLDDLNARGSEIIAAIEVDEETVKTLEDADAIIAAEGRIKAMQNRLRRIDGEILQTRERLATAKDEARKTRLQDLRMAYAKSARSYFAAATNLYEAFSEMMTTREAFIDGGFAVEQTAIPIPPNVGGAAFVAIDPLEAFAIELARADLGDGFKLPRRKIDTTIRIPQSGAHPKFFPMRMVDPTAAAAADHQAAMQRGAALSRARTRRALIDEPEAKGETRLQVVRPGVEHPRHGVLLVSDIISAPIDVADKMVRTGAFEVPPLFAGITDPKVCESEKDQTT